MPAPLSACIVLYHCGHEINQAVRSLQDANVEVDLFLVDNSPEEMTALELQWAYPSITVLPQQGNVGFGRANNAVLPYLRSRYHLLMNPDVTFPPDLLPRMMNYMDAHRNIAILTPRVLNEDGSEQFLPKKRIAVHYLLGGLLENRGSLFRRWREDYTMANQEITAPVPVEFATGCFLLIRTAIFQEMNGFDPRFFLYQEDSDLSRRVLEENRGSIVYHPDMKVTHAWKRENTRTFKGRLRHIHSTFKYFLKWGITW